jgi:large subunit ribosomal protein L19
VDLIRDVVQKRFKTAVTPVFRSGDTVKVHVKIIEGEKARVQVFEGTVIRAKRGGLDSSFTVRKISNGIGVERIFPYYSSAIERVEVVARGHSRRSRLFYLRDLIGKKARLETELESTASAAAAVAKTQKPAAAK